MKVNLNGKRFFTTTASALAGLKPRSVKKAGLYTYAGSSL